MQSRNLILFGAIFVIAGVLSTLLAGVPVVGPVVMAVAVFSFIMMGVTLLRDRSRKRYRDEYDLQLLHDIHQQKEFDRLDPPPADADVVCPHCGSVYGSIFKICPQCRRSP